MATLTPHLEHHLQQDLDLLRSKVLELGARVTRAVARSYAALVASDVTDAEAVILRDRLVDRLEAETERLGLEILVRHQPVGRVLRFVHASLRIIRELERVGDCAESIARQTLSLAQMDPPPELPDFGEQAAIASEMMERALRAYRDDDGDLAAATVPMEDTADGLRDRINQELISRQQSGRLGVRGLTVLLTIARRLERVTDQAKHLCEEMLFVTSGQAVRHAHADAFRLLFVDDTHASVGHLAEAIARRHAGEGFSIHSAGLRPSPPDARVREFLQARGIDTAGLTSRSLGQVPAPEEHHLVVALSDAARIVFPMASPRTLCLYWPVNDPTTAVPDAATAASGVQGGLEAAWHSLEQRLVPLLEAVRRD